MADTLTQKRRSWNMSRIKGKDTKPELLLRSLLHKKGFRFRIHDKRLPGKPDIVLASLQNGDTCPWVFLAQTFRLSLRIYSEIKARVLAEKI